MDDAQTTANEQGTGEPALNVEQEIERALHGDTEWAEAPQTGYSGRTPDYQAEEYIQQLFGDQQGSGSPYLKVLVRMALDARREAREANDHAARLHAMLVDEKKRVYRILQQLVRKP